MKHVKLLLVATLLPTSVLWGHLSNDNSVFAYGNEQQQHTLTDVNSGYSQDRILILTTDGINTIFRDGINTRDTILRDGINTRQTILRDGINTRDTILRDGINSETILRDGINTRDTILRDGINSETILRDGINTETILRDGINTHFLDSIIRDGGINSSWLNCLGDLVKRLPDMRRGRCALGDFIANLFS
jgi:hypothetical protein